MTALNYEQDDRRTDAELGRRDGERNFPPAESETHVFREERLAELKTDISDNRVKRATAQKEADQLISLKEADIKSRSERRKDLEEDMAREERRLEEQHGVSQSRKAAMDNDARFHGLRMTLNREPRMNLRNIYPFLIFCLALLEIPTNFTALENRMPEQRLLVIVICIVVGLLIAVFGHYVGKWTRQFPHDEEADPGRKRRALAAIVTVTGISVALIVTIAVVRQNFLDGAALPLQGGLFEPVAPADNGPHLFFFNDIGLIVLLANLGIFIVASILSFHAHDPEPEYEQAFFDRRKSERDYQAKSRRVTKKRVQLLKRHNRELAILKQQMAALRDEICRLEIHRNHGSSDAELFEEALTDRTALRILTYEAENVRARPDRQIPVSFTSLNISHEDFKDEIALRVVGGGRSAALDKSPVE